MQKLLISEQKIIDGYLKGDGAIILSRKYGYGKTTVHRILKRNNTKIRTLKEANKLSFKNGNRISGLIKFNQQNGRIGYFPAKIDNDFIYVVGYICGDGYISPTNKCVTLYSKDQNHLESISNLTSKKKVRKNRGIFVLHVGGERLFKYFKKLNISGAKSLTIRLPRIPNKYMSHFIRGIFDADGCIWKAGNSPIVNIASGSKNFLKDLKKKIKELINVDFNLYAKKDHYSLEIRGNNKIEKFRKFLYKNADIYLERKYFKFEQLLGD